MKVTVIKTYINENGMSIIKGRKLELDDKAAEKLEAEGIIETQKSVTDKKKSSKK